MRAARLVRSAVYPSLGPAVRWPLPAPLAGACLDGNPALADALPSGDGASYAVSRAVAILLAGLVRDAGRRNVVELGAGSSSRVLARALSLAGGGRLTSVEQSPEWCREAWNAVLATPDVDAQLIVATPEVRVCREGIYPIYASARLALGARCPYDLVFIDAPQWYYGRDGALPLLYGMLQPGALIVLDDAGRPQERWAIRRWLQTYPGLELLAYNPEFGRNGVAVLRHTGNKARRVTPWPWISGGIHLAINRLTRIVRGLRVTAPQR